MDYSYGQPMDNVDASTLSSYQVTSLSTVMTVFSALMRLVTIILNWGLAYDYWISESYAYCSWTILSILIPMAMTSLIYSNVLIVSSLGKKPIIYSSHLRKLVLSYLFRETRTLSWTLKYNQAKNHGDKVAEKQCYRNLLKEECNVGFIRLFDSFLETAPQKILQLAIVLRYLKSLTYFRVLTFITYFLSIAWCIVAYNRSNRLVQLDKYDIGTKGVIVQFWFLLCLTASRTLCIAYVASILPMETCIACILQIILSATLVFIVDSPKFAKSATLNYILCLTFGVVYLFIYTPVKDAPTKYKYLFYLTFCLLQNIVVCIVYIPLYLTVVIIVLYIIGIVLIIYYYLECHPGITSSVF